MVQKIDGYIHVKDQLLLQIPNIIISALALVAALNWNNAIQKLLTQYVPWYSDSGWSYLFFAMLISVIIVVVIVVIINVSHHFYKDFKVTNFVL